MINGLSDRLLVIVHERRLLVFVILTEYKLQAAAPICFFVVLYDKAANGRDRKVRH